MPLTLKDARSLVHTLADIRGEELASAIRKRCSATGLTWDRAARTEMYRLLQQELEAMRPQADADALYVEGCRTIPGKWRTRFFGARVCPDGALLCGDGSALALEIDHGRAGSRVRNAVAKAAFSIHLAQYIEAHVLFV